MHRIVTIVEGLGEVEAVPLLIRRIIENVCPGLTVHVDTPIRVNRLKIVKPGKLEKTVRLAAQRARPGGSILILLDADRDCPAVEGPRLLKRAVDARADFAGRICVVLAKAEYEAWFLAAASSIAGKHYIKKNVTAPANPETVLNAKGWLTNQMPPGRIYSPTAHQAALTSSFDMNSAREASPSFNKMWRDVCSLLADPPDANPCALDS